MCMAAALFGFRQFNREPAALFMGDSGSLFIGFCCACLGIFFLEADLNINNTQLDSFQQRLPVLLALFWFPIADTIRVFILRLRGRGNPLAADQLHLHYQINDQCHMYNVTLLTIYILCSIFSCSFVSIK